MESNYGYIDMHIHSDSSDGELSPKEIVEESVKNNTRIISIADHDSISSIDEFRKSLLKNMIGLNGVEFSSFIEIDNKRYKIHMLGYGFDQNEKSFHQLIEDMKNKRIIAHKKLITGVEENTKVDIEESISKINIERYSWFDREIVKQLKNDGYNEDIIAKIQEYLNTQHFQYGKDYYVDAREVIDIIHKAGGYAVFAHPMDYSFDKDTAIKIILKLAILGVDGIEIYQSECSKEDSQMLKMITEELGLLYSAGSDFHRHNADGRKIGTGINNSLCINETTLTNELIKKKKIFRNCN